MTIRIVFSAVIGLVLAGCTTLGPDYQAPSLPPPAPVSSLDTIAPTLVSDGPVDRAWWAGFDDPILDDLLHRAAANNQDLEAALFRVEAARALSTATSRLAFPRLEASASAQRIQSSEIAGGFGAPPGVPSLQNLFETALSASWEIDLFGRIARRVEAGEAEIEAATEDFRALSLVIQAETAQAYAELRSLQDQLRVARETEALTRRTLTLTELLADRELASEFDLVRARAEVSEAVARQEQLVGGQRTAIARLAVLVGERPSALMDTLLEPKAFQYEARQIPVGLSSDLIARRPDVRAAERRLAAATARIGAEMADLYPSFSLTGGGGFSSVSIDDLIEGPAQTWNISGFIRWPIFDGGIQRAEVDLAEANAKAAFAEYNSAVLNAFADVETSLSAYVYAVRELRGLEAAQADRRRAYELADLRYSAGLDDLFAVLEAQRRLTTLDAELAAARANVLRTTLGVYRALAGGWVEANMTEKAGVQGW